MGRGHNENDRIDVTDERQGNRKKRAQLSSETQRSSSSATKKVTFEQLVRGSKLSLAECFDMEFTMVQVNGSNTGGGSIRVFNCFVRLNSDFFENTTFTKACERSWSTKTKHRNGSRQRSPTSRTTSFKATSKVRCPISVVACV
jgi:hypothetical protein